jgi:hypothetical protein
MKNEWVTGKMTKRRREIAAREESLECDPLFFSPFFLFVTSKRLKEEDLQRKWLVTYHF